MENRKSIFAIANKEKYLTEAPTHWISYKFEVVPCNLVWG